MDWKNKADKALSRWAPAHGYLEAAKTVASRGKHRDHGLLSAPIYLLLGFHAELMLKAYLTHTGASDDDLKAIGHDLRKGYEAAISKGFKSEQPIDEVIELLADGHKSHAFRYLTADEVVVPDIDAILPVLDKWDDELYKLLWDDEDAASTATS